MKTYLKKIRKNFFAYGVFLLISLLGNYSSMSEGTKELMPASNDNGYLQIFDQNTLSRPFASFDSPEPNRLNVHICNPGEIIYMGFRQTDNDVYFRLKDPDGLTVPIPGLNPVAPNTYRLPAFGMGRINTYAEAANGPSVLTPGGYNAIVYNPTKLGDYYIEFNPTSPTVKTPIKRVFTYFDITVASSANKIKKGRVWSKAWDFTTNSGNNQFKAVMYVYSDDGIVTALDFNGMQPFGFSMSCNATGCVNSGNPATDRISRYGNNTYPQYKIFLNDPDNICYPTGSYGSITKPSTITGCGDNRCININVDKAGNISVLLDLNNKPGYDAGTVDRQLYAEVTAGANCIPWDGKDGLGNRLVNGTQINLQIDYFNGLTHLPLFDVEDNPRGYIVTLVRPSGTPPKLFWDDDPINTGTPGDGKRNLAGCGNGNAGCHRWTGRGSNTNPETINTWWFANITSERITYTNTNIWVDADTRNPGKGHSNDTTICGLNKPVQLSGGVGGALGGEWSTSGSGTFSPSNTALNATYTPSGADLAAGKVLLTLLSTGNGPCPYSLDSINMTFSAPPKANAGADQTVCRNNSTVSLNGSFSNASGAKWSGTGSFLPGATSMAATYTPSAAELSSGKATIALITTGNGICPADTDKAVITIAPAPTVIAGSNLAVCANNPAVQLKGTVTNATASQWTGGNGTFSSSTITDPVYTPSAAEVTKGSVKLKLSATRAGCNTVSDSLAVTIKPAPVVNAGQDQTVCFNNPTVTLQATAKNHTSVTWSGGNGKFSPDANTLTATYTPTKTELTTGTVVLTLTASAPGCTDVTDEMKITITPGPAVEAGTTATVCGNNPSLTLNGSVTGATGGIWTGGCGTFVPSAGALNATYTPCKQEIKAGIASLVLTTTGSQNCKPESDTLIILITTPPVPDAGADQSVCANSPTATINGTAANASSYIWSGGNGTYSPNPATLRIQYTPSASEITAGNVTLVLTASRNSCLPVTDTVKITVAPAPVVNAGPDQSVCYNNATVTLNGSIASATGGAWSGGSGSFSRSTSLNTTYTPSATEKNAGSVTLKLTSTGNGACKAEQDEVTVTITPAPAADAGADQTVCANNPNVSLKGSVTLASGGTWSGGGGIFAPNASNLNTVYTPTNAEIKKGSATLTLTTTGNGNCNAVTDQLTVTISPAPVVNPGSDLTVCADNPEAKLKGTVTVATGGTWSGGSGNFNPGSDLLATSYTPTVKEIKDGKVILTLTTVGNGNCNPVSGQVTLNITPAPVVNAGADMTLCGNASSIPLTGSVQYAQGGIWSSSGTGSFSPGANRLSASYVPSTQDKSNGQVTLTLTTTGNGLCAPLQDQMVISFTEIPTINAGPDMIACANNLPAQLNAGGSPSLWNGGTGTFLPDAGAHNATYMPSASEIAAGKVTLTVTTIADGACPAVKDQVTITIPPAPLADAGSDQTLCAASSGILLNGSVSNATGGFWSTSGPGSFAPNANTLKATYVPSAADKSAGKVTLTLTTLGNGTCTAHADDMILTITPAIAVNAGPDQTICGDKKTIALTGIVSNTTGSAWTSSGGGSFTPSGAGPATTYVLSAADLTAGTLKFTLTAPASGACASVSDEVLFTILPPPAVNAGADQTVCADNASVMLAGTVSGTATATWSTTGSGAFSPAASDLNTSYIPSAADITAGKVTFTLTGSNGICPAITDEMTLTVQPSPSVSAGADKTICGDAGEVLLTGSFTGASGVTWKTTGTGSFDNISSASTRYVPSDKDITAGMVVFSLISNGNGICRAAEDQMILTIAPVPVVDAGQDQNLCATAAVAVSGSIKNAAGGTWTSSGSGSFIPSPESLQATYLPSAADTAAGNINLTLITTGNGTCKTYSHAVNISFHKVPAVNAGPDQTICADSFYIDLAGKVLHADGGLWSTSGSGNFSPDAATVASKYMPSMKERNNGRTVLILTSTGNGPCEAVQDSMVLTITPAPQVNAGADQVICADSAYVQLAGSFSTATGAAWATSGTGSFTPSATDMQAKYTPSETDIQAGSVTLSLTTTGNGTCRPATARMKVTITPAPEVNAGSDQTICADQISYNLNGSVTTATGGVWTSSGSGAFSPSGSAVKGTYYPSPADTATGAVTLTLTTTGNGACKTYQDKMVLRFEKKPVADAGTDQTACAASKSVALKGRIAHTTGAAWTSSGTGDFAPNANSLEAYYIPSAADTAAGKVTITLTTAPNGVCSAAMDQMQITFAPVPVVDAGTDQTLCADAEGVQLAGSIFHAPGGTWSGNGMGTLSPDAGALNALYIPVPEDTVAGSIILTLTSTGGICPPVSDNMTITFTPAPTVKAGPDMNVCVGIGSVNLEGYVSVATGGTWSTSGNGTFSDPNALSPIYTPGPGDESSGSVTLTLQTTGNGSCNFYSDDIVINFTIPFISAGNDTTVCDNSFPVQLKGTGTTAEWSGGLGTFTPNARSLNAGYTPHPSEAAQGYVKLILTTINDGTCTPGKDSVVISILPGPTVEAGPDQNICKNTPFVSLGGSVTVATGGKWTSSGSGSFANDNSASTTYVPSAADLSSGSITFTLTTTGNGSCTASRDKMNVTILPAPVVNAGLDQVVCANRRVRLNASFSNTTGIQWSGYEGTFSTGNQDPNAIYTPSAGEITNGLTLIATATGTGICPAVSDSIHVSFSPAPSANAGQDKTFCASAKDILLDGSVNLAQGGVWSAVNGTGTFSPGPADLHAKYIPSPADTAAHTVTLRLTTSGNGTCNAVTDEVSFTLVPVPVVNAGADDTLCANNAVLSLKGAVFNAAGATWTTMGSGTFVQSATTLSNSYQPSGSDIVHGGVTLLLTSEPNGPCPAVSDYKVLTITDAPVAMVNGGLDQKACADASAIQMNGFISIASGGEWATSGDGFFTPNTTDLNAIYHPSPADRSKGAVTITLTSTGNGSCKAVYDDMLLSITPAPAANAVVPSPICADAASVPLSASVTVATGIKWTSSGSGTFSPNATAMNAVYLPSPSDKLNGSVGLTLTTTGNGTCRPVFHDKTLTITKSPVATAGPDQTVCANTSAVGLNGKLTVATGGVWTSSGDGTFINPGVPNARYIPGPLDTAGKVVMLTLTTTSGLGTCKPVNDQVQVSFEPVPLVNAGPDVTICAAATLLLDGKVYNAQGGKWSTTGSGIFSDAGFTKSAYKPSQADITKGSVTLTLTSSGNGKCKAVNDELTVNLQAMPEVNTGAAKICEVNLGAPLNGSVINAAGGIWSTSGTGTFSPDASAVNASYYPSPEDVSSGKVRLTLTSSGNGVCNAVAQQVVMTIDPMPIANAGQDQFICEGSSVRLTAQTSPGVIYRWHTRGGTTLSGAPVVNITANSDTTLVLTVSNAKGCSSTDTVNVSVYQLPVFHLDPHYCMSNSIPVDSRPEGVPNVPGVFQWYRYGTILTGQNAPVITPSNPGTYMVIYSYGNCAATATTSVTKPPVLSHRNYIACENSSIGIQMNSNVTRATYTWETGQSGTDLRSVTVSVAPDTSFYTVTVTDAAGCSSADSVRVIGVPVPEFSMNNFNSCQGMFDTLVGKPVNIADPEKYGATYKWYMNNTPLSETSYMLRINQTGWYKVKVTIGECISSDSALATFNPMAVAVHPDKVKFCKETDHYAIVEAGTTGAGNTYHWTPPVGVTLDSATSSKIAAPSQGFYTVEVNNNYNCPVKDSIFVKEVCPPKVFVPTAITPEIPGTDQTLKVFGAYFTNYKMEVYNRWGEIIFISTDRNQSWDGTYNGQLMPVGVYPWVVTYEGEDPDNKGPYMIEGSVTIIR